jgi:hypothetical protein
MIEVVACDVNGAELPELGRRFHDSAPPEVLIDGTTYYFVRFKAPGVALYSRRPPLPHRKRARRRGDPAAA